MHNFQQTFSRIGIATAMAVALPLSSMPPTAHAASAPNKLVQVNCKSAHDLSISVDKKKNHWGRYCFRGKGSISVHLYAANGYISKKKGHMWVSRTNSGWKSWPIEKVCAPFNPPLNISSISLY